MKYKEYYDLNPEIPFSDIEQINKDPITSIDISDEGWFEQVIKFLTNKLPKIDSKDIELLRMKFLDYSLADISSITGDSLSAIKTRSFRLRHRLKPLLLEWKNGTEDRYKK